MALEIKKDKNIIYLDNNDTDQHYYININNDAYYNAKTKREVKRIPFKKNLYYDCESRYNELKQYYNACWVQIIRGIFENDLHNIIQNVDRYLNLMASFNVRFKNYLNYNYYVTEHIYDTIFKNAKVAKRIIDEDNTIAYYPTRLANQIKTLLDPKYDEVQVNPNFTDLEKRDFWEKYQILKNSTVQDLYYYYGYKQKYLKCLPSDQLLVLIQEYVNNCKALGKEPIATQNGIREFSETALAVQQMKEKHDREKWTEIYTRLVPKVLFEYGDYTVVLPEKPDDLILEGARMHHCVGGYVNQVIDETTYIIFIREKNNTKAPYITAQITPKGKLDQYYLEFDRNIDLPVDKEFKNAYQEHLDKVWKK